MTGSLTVFVTGTDTGIGKTHVARLLLGQARERGMRCAGFKPVAAGGTQTAQGIRNEDAVALQEALLPDFKLYARRVIENARALAEAMVEGGRDLVSGGTDNHLLLVDLRPKRLTGRAAEDSLERAGITCNMNGIPFDPEKPTVTSGIRLGSPAATTRGFGVAQFQQTGRLIVEVLDGLAANPDDNGAVEQRVRAEVERLCARFPIYRRDE